MKALSIRQPWAWFILNAGKDIENRCWATRFRGRFFIHAAAGMTKAEQQYAEDLRFAFPTMPPAADLERGGIVGTAVIVDCVRRHPSPWFEGEWGFVLRNPQPLAFIPCKGRLGFFDIPDPAKAEA